MQKSECRSKAATGTTYEISAGFLLSAITDTTLLASHNVPMQTSAVSVPSEKPFDLRIRTKSFALRIVRLYRTLPRSEEARIIGKQLLRAGTSIGANYRAACRSRSRAEFISKIGIVLEEADESVFWLELLLAAEILTKAKIEDLLAEANELTSIFVATLRTTKGVTSAF